MQAVLFSLLFMGWGYEVQAHQRTCEASRFLGQWDQKSYIPGQLIGTRIVCVGSKSSFTRVEWLSNFVQVARSFHTYSLVA